VICKRLGIAAFVLLAAIIAMPLWSQKPAQSNSAIRFVNQDLPSGVQFNTGFNTPILAISPDGKQFVCDTSEGLYLCSADGSTSRLLKGTRELMLQPFFSPDGNWIGYFSVREGKLKKISTAGDKPVHLRSAPIFRGASWNEDGSIVYSVYDIAKGSLAIRISSTGENPETVLKIASGRGSISFPQMLPGGKSLLYTAILDGRAQIEVKPLIFGVRKVLFEGYGARYLPFGYIVYHLVDKDGVYVVPFDPAGLKVTGNPIRLIANVWQKQYAVSDSGTLIYIPGEDTPKSPEKFSLVWVSRDGREEPISVEPNNYSFPKVSPDGTRVALAVTMGKNRQICVWDLVRQRMIPLTAGETDNIDPLWTPDGKQIIYRSSKDGTNVIVNSTAADGSGEPEKIAAIPSGGYLISWLREGKELSLIPFHGKYNEDFLQVSPDRRWIAYASNESGQNEIYVRSFSDAGKGVRQVSIRGGNSPLWSPDGRELLYRDADSIIAVPVEPGTIFKAGIPKALFGRPYVSASVGRIILPMWDISPDGKRFLMMKAPKPAEQPPTTTGPRKVRVVQNWLEALKEHGLVK
jgi:Tol biopolymer transport system component